MEKLVKGDVVVLPFPFSDLSSAKKRPALVVAALEGDDSILCQITSQQSKDKYSVELNDEDFQKGKLSRSSAIRPNKIFTADKSIVLYKAGSLRKNKTNETVESICNILKGQ